MMCMSCFLFRLTFLQTNLSLTFYFPGWFAASWLGCNNTVVLSEIISQGVGMWIEN